MFHKKKKSAKQQKTEDYEKLGKQIESMYDAVRPDRGALYRTEFFKGVVGGVGRIIGATVVIALLLWILSLLTHVPFVSDIVDNIRNTVQNR